MNDIRIALVDDHQLYRQVIREILSSKPEYRVVGEADNGRTAVDIIKDTLPDIILLDISMPDMDGICAIEHFRRVHPKGRIILVTMH